MQLSQLIKRLGSLIHVCFHSPWQENSLDYNYSFDSFCLQPGIQVIMLTGGIMRCGRSNAFFQWCTLTKGVLVCKIFHNLHPRIIQLKWDSYWMIATGNIKISLRVSFLKPLNPPAYATILPLLCCVGTPFLYSLECIQGMAVMSTWAVYFTSCTTKL